MQRATDKMPSSSAEDRDGEQGNRTCNAQEETEPMGESIHKLLAANVNLLLREHDVFDK